jgi:hypothetical protein
VAVSGINEMKNNEKERTIERRGSNFLKRPKRDKEMSMKIKEMNV